MCEYALTMLGMLEYACIYLNKQSSECDKVLIVSDPVHSIRSLYKLLSSYWCIQDTVKHLRRSILQTFCVISGCRRHQKLFRAGEGLWN